MLTAIIFNGDHFLMALTINLCAICHKLTAVLFSGGHIYSSFTDYFFFSHLFISDDF